MRHPADQPIAHLLNMRSRLPQPAERRAIRERLGLSREPVARELGVTQQTLVQWESGNAEPRAVNLAAYVELLDRLRALASTEPKGRDSVPSVEHDALGGDR